MSGELDMTNLSGSSNSSKIVPVLILTPSLMSASGTTEPAIMKGHHPNHDIIAINEGRSWGEPRWKTHSNIKTLFPITYMQWKKTDLIPATVRWETHWYSELDWSDHGTPAKGSETINFKITQYSLIVQ